MAALAFKKLVVTVPVETAEKVACMMAINAVHVECSSKVTLVQPAHRSCSFGCQNDVAVYL
eukprot:3386037-Pleurochrysis_carterae.AAC.1